jgi:ATP-binding cassette subfamily B (MDR/TAP) protein 1
MFLAIFFALLEGLVWPAFSVVFAQSIYVVIDKNQKASTMAFWCAMLFVVGVGNVISSYFRLFFMNLAGGRLTKHLRNLLFKFLLRQDISWFDDSKHSQGFYEAT